MKSLLLIYLILPACLGNPKKTDFATRIVGGDKAAIGQFPYIVVIKRYGDNACSGAIIAPNKIVTSAVCVELINGARSSVVAGINSLDETGQTVSISKAIAHEKYKLTTVEIYNDIGVMYLDPPLKYNDRVQPIKLRTAPVKLAEKLIVSGWGNIHLDGRTTKDLKFLNVNAIDLSVCKAIRWDVNTTNVCTMSPRFVEGICIRDSGDPLVDSNGQLVGIASYGLLCGLGMPDVFTAISAFYDWIQNA